MNKSIFLPTTCSANVLVEREKSPEIMRRLIRTVICGKPTKGRAKFFSYL
jgi:hypothetical protein